MVGTRARVKSVPHQISVFFPTFSWFFWFVRNPHAEEEGQIICVEEGQHTKRFMYTVFFTDKNGSSTYTYFEEDLVFL